MTKLHYNKYKSEYVINYINHNWLLSGISRRCYAGNPDENSLFNAKCTLWTESLQYGFFCLIWPRNCLWLTESIFCCEINWIWSIHVIRDWYLNMLSSDLFLKELTGNLILLYKRLKEECSLHTGGGHFVNTPGQWDPTLHCNVVSHWLGAYTKWFHHGPYHLVIICTDGRMAYICAVVNEPCPVDGTSSQVRLWYSRYIYIYMQ